MPLNIVETALYKKINGLWTEIESINGSDSPQTLRNTYAKSFTFGTIASGEVTTPIIMSLRIPNTQKINDIKIALTNTGGITFANDIFGVTTYPALSSNMIPSTYFQGVNTDNNDLNIYNISVKNLTDNTSEYVYLNISFPSNQYVNYGVLKFRWFFSYFD
jgi:hypothetical protein